MNYKTRRLIIKYLRQASLYCEERRVAKVKAKVAPATYECASCKHYIYTGAKDLENTGLDEYTQKGITIRKDKVHMDHIETISDPNKDLGDWSNPLTIGTYILRMFCSYKGWQCLCVDCHDKKTQKENKIRNKNRKSKKKCKKV